MIPSYRIILDNKNITDRISPKLESLTVSDNTGVETDTVEIVIDGKNIKPPEENSKLEVAFGYKDNLIDMGQFIIKKTVLKGPPDILTITGTALGAMESMTSQRAEVWEETSVAEIIETIASRNNLVARVAQIYQNITINHIDQQESDNAFLKRLSDDYNGIFKPISGYLVFVEKGSSKTASGALLPQVSVTKHIDHNYSNGKSNAYTGVRTFWWDDEEEKRKSVLVGSAGNVYQHRFNLRDEATAKSVAESKFKKIKRVGRKLMISVEGKPQYSCERICNVKNVSPEIDGKWLITSVKHVINSSGYISRIEFENLE